MTELVTERLVLRRLTPEDAPDLVALDGDPEVVRYAEPELADAPRTLADVEARLLPRLMATEDFWAVTERAGGAFLGWVFLRPDRGDAWELGYRLRRAAWGHGFATEACAAAIEHGTRARGARRVVAYVHPGNAGSVRVAEKLGLARTGETDEHGDDVFELRPCG